MGVPASQRLRKPSEFQQIRRSDYRVHCGPFVIQYLQRDADHAAALPRLGVIASRRVGNAVKRNRGKRLVREIFRCQAAILPAGSWVVVVLRAGFEHYTFAMMEREFINACARMLRRAAVEASSR